MKIVHVILMTSLVIWPTMLYGQEISTPHVQIDFEAISLQPPFTDHEDTYREFRKLARKFGLSLRRRHSLYDDALIADICAFIAQHPSDTAALTAKLYLAEYLCQSWFEFKRRVETELLEGQTELLEGLLDDMVTVYQSIASEASETWQGRLASHYTREYFIARLHKNEVYREKRQAMWPLLLEIQHERDFHMLRIYKSQIEPVEVIVSAERIWFALEEGDIPAAEEELVRLKERYPDSVKIERAEKNIAAAYKRQFEGGLHSLTNVELLDLLTSSQDPLKVKHAAAAFGNLEIWGTLHPTDWLLNALNETVLSYIDRAASGTSEEQEEAVELLYRLWHLSVPMLLQTLDQDDPTYVELAADLLVYMRDEEVITAIIEKARSTEGEQKKAQLIGLLARMNEPCVPVMRFRECLDDAHSEELYQRVVVPVLQEFQAQ